LTSPTINSVTDVDSYAGPAKPTVDADFSFDLYATAPGAPPTLDIDIPIVTDPIIGRPTTDTVSAIGTLASFTNQELSPLTNESFEVTPPSANLPGLTNEFNYKETREFGDGIWTKSELQIVETIALINEGLKGKGVLPHITWTDFWSKATANLGRVKQASFREADREHASRGWAMPGGVMLARRETAKQTYEEDVTKLLYEQTIAGLQMVREDLYKTIDLAFGLKKMIADVDHQYQERALRAQSSNVEFGISIYNSAVAAFQANIQAIKITSDSKRMKLDALLGSVELLRVKVERERVKGEFNTHDVGRYSAEVEKAKLGLQEYAEWTDAIKAKTAAQQTAVSLFGEQINRYAERTRSWAGEWDGYGKRVDAAKVRVMAFDSKVGLSAQKINAAQIGGQQAQWKMQGDIDISKLLLDGTAQELEKYKAEAAQLANYQTVLSQVFNTNAELYKTIHSIKSANADTALNRYKADIDQARLDLEGKIEGARQKLAYWSATTTALLEWQNRKSGVLSTLGSSAYTAANVTMSAGVDFSYGERQSIDYSESQTRTDHTSTTGSLTLGSGETVPPLTPTLPTPDAT
jgi:hypothetical protein